jgi:hypothetical protein
VRALLVLLLVAACGRSHRDLPEVQFSSDRPRDTDVRVTDVLSFSPGCVVIDVDETVEWWVDPNAPAVPVNVTSLGTPIELFSPSLVTPYGCDSSDPDRVCWRHTFETAGCFPYYDTNSGSPGRPVVDDYYGTITYVGGSGDVEGGTICVEGPGVSCRGVCCNGNFDCSTGFTCQVGRCTRSDGEQSPCPALPLPDAGLPDAGDTNPDASITDASVFD